MSRAALARLVLGIAVAVSAAAAVLTLATLRVPATTDSPSAPTPASDPAAALSDLRAAPEGERVVVVRVIDAVTFDARLPDGGPVIRVRALGVQPPGTCYDAQATAFASRVLDRRAVTLTGDRASDRFDRRLASVAMSGGADYAVLAAEAGIARAYATDAAPAAMPAVRAAQDRARLAERGVWGPPCLGAATPNDTRSAAGTATDAVRSSRSDAAGGR
ncbi:thermonuclease family protein [Actinomycetospora sp. NBRC 106375]|uniref:thermonuclease family protein n=1 Tax=Actinomycetospora sp. NBRC 106375 TaxID=3032207 RepID=UPI002553F008|nr:thermonuclease family protein [Actinomycetospora sp. NBRC 106375]